MRHDGRLSKYEDLTGMQFGDFIALRFDNSRPKYKYYWICQCVHCGYEKSIATASLKKLKSINCNNCSEKFGIPQEPVIPIDLTGQRFGRLRVVEYAGSSKQRVVWKCVCDCGSIVYKTTTQLRYSRKLLCDKCWGKIKDPEMILQNRDSPEILATLKKYTKIFQRNENVYEFHEDYVLINDKIIIDKDDFNLIDSFSNKITINSSGYAVMKYFGKDLFLHRIILGLPVDFNNNTKEIGEHKDGNRLNNRKNNLRICIKENNAKNCALYKNNTSGVKGVSWLPRLNKYQVSINVNKKNIYLGVYSDINEATKIRKEAEEKYFGEFKRADEHLHNTHKE